MEPEGPFRQLTLAPLFAFPLLTDKQGGTDYEESWWLFFAGTALAPQEQRTL